MPQAILHKDGAYQLYTTVADGPCYEQALTLDELKEVGSPDFHVDSFIAGYSLKTD